jgi:hypothetical protein
MQENILQPQTGRVHVISAASSRTYHAASIIALPAS